MGVYVPLNTPSVSSSSLLLFTFFESKLYVRKKEVLHGSRSAIPSTTSSGYCIKVMRSPLLCFLHIVDL